MSKNSRRKFIKDFSIISSGIIASSVLYAHEDHIHGLPESTNTANPEIIGHGEFKYKVHADWGKLDSKQYPIVNCHAMVQTKDGNLHALCDGIRNNFLVYDKDGKLLRSWGTEFTGAHGLEVFEENGKEYFIVVDGGWAVRNDKGRASREQGRVVKISTDGKLIFSIGHPVTVGAYEAGWRFQPCDAAVAKNGDIYIADGYGSNWVLQYNKLGQFIRKFGGNTDPNTNARLKCSHGISIDYRDAQKPKLVVSSRSENKLKVFTLDGKFQHNIDVPGAFLGQAVFHGENVYAGVCWSKEKGTGKRLSNSGFVTILDKNNQVISNPGGSEPKYENGKLSPIFQTTKTFRHVHDVCVDRDGNIYALQWNSGGAYPIKLERI